MGQYDKAEPFFINAKEIYKETVGEKHPSFATALNNLAELYRLMGQYEKAKPMYIQAKDILKEALGVKHPIYTESLNNLAGLYESMSQYNKAEPLYLKGIENLNEQIQTTFDFMTETEKESFYKTISYNFEIYYSFFLKYKQIKPEVSIWPYNIELTQKGIILKSGSELRNAIIDSGDTILINKFYKFTELKKQLAFLYSQQLDKQKKDSVYIKNIEEKSNATEKEMTRNSKIYCEAREADTLKWSDIQNGLCKDEATIEFASFHYHNGKKWTDSTYYCALVLRPVFKQPEMIYLFEQKQLDSILMQVIGNDEDRAGQLYAIRGTKINATRQSLYFAPKLYKLIWKPIEPFLKGVSTIYYSPSGSLHKISFAAIVTPDSTYLSDKYRLVQLGSTREIVKLKKQNDYITLSDSALVYGGINYDQMNVSKDTIGRKEILAYNRGPQIPTDSSRVITWSPLPGTLKEAKYIDSLFRKNKVATEFYSGSEATETLFKNISGKAPQIIHISTHGFFFPEPKEKRDKNAFTAFGEQTYRFSENPLLRSGLILAGANFVWKGGEQTLGKDDGILTAYEVSNMNLYKTKLVVLSACETGLGDIKGSEGVFGLQRAFKMAGADYIIMSLWQVPDTETVEFMKQFYTNCFNKQTIRESFNNAQDWMKKNYPNDPYKWAAFVLIE